MSGSLYRRPESEFWMMKFTDNTGRVVRRSTKCREQDTAAGVLTKTMKAVEQRRAGIIDGDIEGELRTMDELVAAHLRYLRAKRNSDSHIESAERELTSMVDHAKFRKSSDIHPAKINAWLTHKSTTGKTQRIGGVLTKTNDPPAASTVNKARGYVSMFLSWLKSEGIITDNPISRVMKIDQDDSQTRRGLTGEEFFRILEVAEPYRRVAYLLSVYTGFRVGELKELAAGRFIFNPDSLLAGIRLDLANKSNRRDVQALPEWMTDLVRGLIDGLGPEDRCFDRSRHMPFPKLDTFYRDCERAGIPLMVGDRKVDRHALRTTFATWLAVNKADRRLTQMLMRHTDAKLTDRIYTDAGQLETSTTINALPRMMREGLDLGYRATRPRAIGAVSQSVSALRLEQAETGSIRQNADSANPCCDKDLQFSPIGVAGFEATTPSKSARQIPGKTSRTQSAVSESVSLPDTPEAHARLLALIKAGHVVRFHDGRFIVETE